jgi:hypothetical protein
MINHVTYQVPPKGLTDEQSVRQLDLFFGDLELYVVPPDLSIEKDWTVRWYSPANGGTIIHLVEPREGAKYSDVNLGLGHFCVEVSELRYSALCNSKWLEHSTPGSPRIWVRGPFGLRAEVRAQKQAQPVDEGRSAIENRVGVHERDLVRIIREKGEISLGDPAPKDDALRAIIDQEAIMERAIEVYRDRNVHYRDNWRRMGWRGMLFRIRERAERAWDALWDADPEGPQLQTDDLIDLINFCGFAIRAIEDGNRDGSWWGEMR